MPVSHARMVRSIVAPEGTLVRLRGRRDLNTPEPLARGTSPRGPGRLCHSWPSCVCRVMFPDGWAVSVMARLCVADMSLQEPSGQCHSNVCS